MDKESMHNFYRQQKEIEKNTKMMWKKENFTLHDSKEHILSSVVRLKQGMLVPKEKKLLGD